MNDFKVSVVIPAYNAERFVEEAIESVLSQNYDNVETIVVDDGSIDSTPNILQRYRDRISVIRQQNAGASAARNAGLLAAKGVFVKFLDSDDFLAENSLAQQLAAARDYAPGERVVVYSDALWVEENGRPIQYTPQPASPVECDPVGHIAWAIEYAPLTSCPLHTRRELLAVGGFDTRAKRGQEYDLHVRMAITGVRFKRIEGFSYHYRQHRGPRISGKAHLVAPEWLATSVRQYELVERRFQVVPSEIRRALARQIWRQGRELVQAGAWDHARAFFLESRRICRDEEPVGSRAYRLVVSALGPVWGERLYIAATKMVSGRQVR
jgi:glycosyltransferase involved in cell wall biosynthesis